MEAIVSSPTSASRAALASRLCYGAGSDPERGLHRSCSNVCASMRKPHTVNNTRSQHYSFYIRLLKLPHRKAKTADASFRSEMEFVAHENRSTPANRLRHGKKHGAFSFSLPGLQCWVLPSPKLSPDGAPSWGINFEVYCVRYCVHFSDYTHSWLQTEMRSRSLTVVVLYLMSGLTMQATTTAGPPTGVAVCFRLFGWNGSHVWTTAI